MSALRFYNSLDKDVVPFEPLHPGKVRMYNCGPTVYKRQHLGNMRRYLFSDFLRRTLEFFGLEVKEIMNITDVGHLTQDELDAGEDKLEVAAREAKVTPQDIAVKQTKLFEDDITALNIQPAHAYPRASQFIPQMQQLIADLLARGHAYQTSDGVYFSVESFPAYGKLSGNTLDHIASGARVAVRSEKRHPADFALWVVDPEHLQHWDSPWGVGYPGWHIECSAMSLDYLGTSIDIHTGGEDNRFPHHENEIAQSEAATGKPFVRFWMHNRHLQLQGVKLAKRDGEQLTLDTLREKGFSPLAFRLFAFGAHYRTPLEFSWESLADAQKNLDSFRGLLRRLHEQAGSVTSDVVAVDVLEQFGDALSDDLNTPAALAVLMDYVRSLNTQLGSSAVTADQAAQFLATLLRLDHVLGIFSSLERELELESIPPAIQQLVADRDQARSQRDFDRADKLRVALEEQGFSVEDTPLGTRVVRMRQE